MNLFQHSTYELDELLFEKRNRAYGAYQLRKSGNRYKIYGFIAAILIVGLGFTSPLLIQLLKKESETDKIKYEQKKVVNYSQLSAPPPIEALNPPQPKVEKEPPKVSTKKFVKPVVKPDEEVIDEEEIPTQDELKKVNAGYQTVEGIDSIITDNSVVEPPPPKPIKAPEPKVFISVQESPEFPGGERAMMKFMASNLKYPEDARELEIEGLVVVQFVINPEGNVTNISFLKSLGYVFEEATIKMLNKMPSWKPGVQNGRKVSVRFTLPVKFRIKR